MNDEYSAKQAAKVLGFILGIGFLLGIAFCAGCVEAQHPLPDLKDHMSIDYPMPEEAPVKVAVINLNVDYWAGSQDQFEVILESALNNGAEAFVINIDSYGGIVQEANHIAFDLIDVADSFPVVCVVTHEAASAAYLIFQACPVRVMQPGSELMVHEASIRWELSESVSQLVYNIGYLQRLNDAMEAVNCGRLKDRARCVSSYRSYPGEEWFIPADAAVELGAADRIGTLRHETERLAFPEGVR